MQEQLRGARQGCEGQDLAGEDLDVHLSAHSIVPPPPGIGTMTGQDRVYGHAFESISAAWTSEASDVDTWPRQPRADPARGAPHLNTSIAPTSPTQHLSPPDIPRASSTASVLPSIEIDIPELDCAGSTRGGGRTERRRHAGSREGGGEAAGGAVGARTRPLEAWKDAIECFLRAHARAVAVEHVRKQVPQPRGKDGRGTRGEG